MKAEKEEVVDLVWEQPPEKRDQKYNWSQIAAQLKARPGEWARVFAYDRTSIVNAIRQGAVRPLDPQLGFEVRTRNNVRSPVRMCSLFMRYNPDGKED